jgi:hypothetical protein
MALWSWRFERLLSFFGIGLGELVALGVELVVDAFDLGEREFFGGPVGGADGVGAFEGHVLEHVGEAGGPLGSSTEPAFT